MPSPLHLYGPGHCTPCGFKDCTQEKPVTVPRYRDPCRHPEDALIQMSQQVCDPDLVTVCTVCGTAFPGQTKADLLVA